MLTNSQIKTKRFFLRCLTTLDATQKYLAWMTDAVTKKYIVSASEQWTIGTLKKFILKVSEKEDALFLGIFVLETNEHIGNIKLERLNRTIGSCELGVLIGEPSWRGRGVFSEVFHALQEYVGTELGIERIFLGVDKSNTVAIQSYIKSGFMITEVKYFKSMDSDKSITMVASYQRTNM